MKELLEQVREGLYGLSYEEQDEFIVTLANGIQATRRSELDKARDNADYIETHINSLKEKLCNASNLSRT
jgi:hypothetical protein